MSLNRWPYGELAPIMFFRRNSEAEFPVSSSMKPQTVSSAFAHGARRVQKRECFKMGRSGLVGITRRSMPVPCFAPTMR